MTKPKTPRDWETQARAVGGADSDEELSQASLLHAPAPTPEPPYDPEGVNSMVRGMLAGTPEPRPHMKHLMDGAKRMRDHIAGTPETPDTENRINDSYAEKRIETPSALSAADVSINEATRIIKKIEACEGMPAKLLVLRGFGDRYAADLRSKLSTVERELAKHKKYLQTERGGHLGHCNANHQGPIGGDACCCSPYRHYRRAKAVEAELARKNAALREIIKYLKPLIDERIIPYGDEHVLTIAEVALRTGGEPKK